MFIGHFALAFGAKRAAPSVSLGMLFLACQFADLLWPTLVLLGLEQVEVDPGNTAFTPLHFVSYPYSHSLVMLLVWSVLIGATYQVVRHATLKAALVVSTLVFSHFVLDVITHRPDMPITISGSTKVGLGLWNAPVATIIIESVMFIAGVTLYATTRQRQDKKAGTALWVLVGVLVAIYFASAFGPPPPSATAVVISAELLWLFVAWAYWIDTR
jgi:FtsH-binding integral membrane protein